MGIVDLLEPNDQVMADKGFLTAYFFDKKKTQSSLIILSFLPEKEKFSSCKVAQTHEIARVRIHVERFLRRIKEYCILIV